MVSCYTSLVPLCIGPVREAGLSTGTWRVHIPPHKKEKCGSNERLTVQFCQFVVQRFLSSSCVKSNMSSVAVIASEILRACSHQSTHFTSVVGRLISCLPHSEAQLVTIHFSNQSFVSPHRCGFILLVLALYLLSSCIFKFVYLPIVGLRTGSDYAGEHTLMLLNLYCVLIYTCR